MHEHADKAVLRQQEYKKREYYDRIKQSLLAVDPEFLSQILKEGKGTCSPVPDIEYSRLGNDQYSFFYNLLHAFYEHVCSAYGDKELINSLVSRFRKCSLLLLEYGILPDMKTMTAWDAITTGTLRNPFLLKAYNANQSEAAKNDKENDSDNITDISNMQYPQYMPYLEYTPEQRLLFDEFVFFTGILERDQRKDGHIKNMLTAYNFDEIKEQARELCGKADESEIIEKAELDEMNIRLAFMFDFLLKSAHAIMKEKHSIEYEFDHDKDRQDNFIANNRINNITTHILRESDTEYDAASAHNIFDVADMTPSLAKKISPQTAQAAVRIGAALFSPAVMAKANIQMEDEGILTNGLRFDELLEMTEEYYRFKKSLFVQNIKPMQLKDLSEIAEIPMPRYLGMLRSTLGQYVKDPFGIDIKYENVDAGKNSPGAFPSPWSDKHGIGHNAEFFYWLKIFAGFANPEQNNLLYDFDEVKKIFGLPDTSDNYRAEAIASVKEEFNVPDNYGEEELER